MADEVYDKGANGFPTKAPKAARHFNFHHSKGSSNAADHAMENEEEMELDRAVERLKASLLHMRQQDDEFAGRLKRMQRSIDDVRSYCWLVKTRSPTCNIASHNAGNHDDDMCVEIEGGAEWTTLQVPSGSDRTRPLSLGNISVSSDGDVFDSAVSATSSGLLLPDIGNDRHRVASRKRQSQSFSAFRRSRASKIRGKSTGDDAFSRCIDASGDSLRDGNKSPSGSISTIEEAAGGHIVKSRSKGSLTSWLFRKLQHS
eukprot:m.21034 g.21034  ORF g.21034 m.21034 type:complete len:258 (+) comp28129_c0_seq2:133-906(+)